MTQVNILDVKDVGSATMQNGDFLTFDGLANNKFSLSIPNLPNVQFFVQTFELPDVSIREVGLRTPIVDYNEIGEKLNFNPFILTFMVDKYLRNWVSVFNWMKAITSRGSNVGGTTDIVLFIDGKEAIRFYGAWPTSLSGLSLDSTVGELQYVKAKLALNYDYFEYIGEFKTEDSGYK